jgi:hypothetical protein
MFWNKTHKKVNVLGTVREKNILQVWWLAVQGAGGLVDKSGGIRPVWRVFVILKVRYAYENGILVFKIR